MRGERGRVVHAQMLKLLDLLSEDGILVDGNVVYTRTTRTNFWKDIAMQLNAVPGGVYKNPWKWCKMWADWKAKTKKKANMLLNKKKYNTDSSTAPLTSLELRVLKLMGYPTENNKETLKLEMVMFQSVDKVEVQDGFEMEFLNEDEMTDTSHTAQSHTDNIVSDDENKTSGNSEYNGNDVKSKECDESSDEELLCVKNKDKLFKRRKQSLEEYKIKTTLRIEKEKIQQKSEDMRLKALELKLKGEELKLKEAEMNKINFLTNIEEEKLKCFREISSSLKVLLERTNSGNLRVQNGIS